MSIGEPHSDVFEDVLEWSPSQLIRGQLWQAGIAVFGFGILFLLGFLAGVLLGGVQFLQRNGAQFSGLLALLVVVGGIMLCIRIPASLFFARWTLPRKIILTPEELVVQTPSKCQTFRLADCSWFVGTTHDDTGIGIHLAKTTALVLQLPKESSKERLCCCLDQDQREHWIAGLEKLGIPNEV